MGFGNFLKGVVAQVNPFDRGKTYGSYNPKKKRPEDENQASTPGGLSVAAPQQNPTIQVQRPQNHFDTGITQLRLPGSPNTSADPLGVLNHLSNPQPPQPGTVVKPTLKVAPAPEQNLRVGNVSVPRDPNMRTSTPYVAPQKGYMVPEGVTGNRGTKNGSTGTYVTSKKDPTKTNFIPDIPKPQDNRFWQKVGRGFKTAGETVGGTIANVPEVGLAAVRAGTGIVEGATQLPHIVTATAATGTEKLANKWSNPVTRQVNRGFQDINTGTKNVTNVVDKPINWVNTKLDQGAQGYANHVPLADSGAKVYKYEQIPLNVLAALVTMGGSTAAEGAAQAGRAGEAADAASQSGRVAGLVNKFQQLLNKPIGNGGAADNAVSKTAQFVTEHTNPVVEALNTPIGSSKRAIQTRVNNLRNVQKAEQDLVDAGEAGNILSDAGNAGQGTQIPVGTGVDVNAPPTEPVNIPVKVNTPARPTGQPIIEVAGDTPGRVSIPTQEEVAAQRAASRFADQPTARPDTTVEGIKPPTKTQPFSLTSDAVKANEDKIIQDYADFLKSMGEGNGTQLVPDGEGGYTRTSNNVRFGENKGKRMTKQDWLDQAEKDLRSGKAEPGTQQAFNDASNPEVQSMLNKGDTSVEPGQGRPITVKQVTGIPVTDKTVVPTNLPETPGSVRVTTSSAPASAEAAAVAAQTPGALPVAADAAKTIGTNGAALTKRQVAAARNQAKLARQKAKADEATAAAMDRSLSAKPTGDKGFVPSGEYRRGSNGNVSQTAKKTLEEARGAQDTTNLSVSDVLDQARNEINDNGVVSPQTVRNLKAIRDSGRFPANSPEFKAINDEYKAAISNHGRALALTDRTARASANGDQLTNRFTSKLLTYVEDTSKVSDADIAEITRAENAFTDARDAANAAGERFKQTGAQEDFNAWKAAQQQAETADRNAKITEYQVSKRVLKGNKNIEAAKAVQEAERNAGIYSMDSIDANMLSGTGTMVRNYINTLFPRAENKLFGRLSSRLVKPIEITGGSSGRGARIGSQIGKDIYKADIAARKDAGVGFVRRWVTAGNTTGERNIQAQTYSKAFDHYKQLLKSEGYTGKELANRAEFNVRTDPMGLVKQYEQDTLQANALSGLTQGNKKIENWLSDTVQRKLADAGIGSKGQTVGRGAAKAATRVTLGFPTVIARSLVEGMKRATLGIPEAGWSTVKYLNTGNKEAFANELSKAIQHAGTGGSLMLLGHALGKMGVVSGAYPSDPNERARWEAEGKQENSIKIGGQWFSIPGYFGGFALPLMFGASTADGNLKGEASFKNAWDTILSASPVDNVQSTLEIMTGNGSDAKLKNAASSLVRSVTPAGSFLAEIAKLTDKTQNDTTRKDMLHNIIDQVAGGIPGVNNMVNKENKTDQYGNVLTNPNPIAQVLGAQGSEQSQGTQAVQAEQTGANDTYAQLSQYGVTGNKSLMGLVDPKIAQRIANNEQLTPEEVQKVQKAVTKGVTASDDSNWRESGDYTTDKAALQTKLDMLNADPTTKPSEKKAYQDQITRDDVLQNNNIPYDQLKLYQSTSLSDWRAMGDPESDQYDPQTYSLLWSLDQAFTQSGVSYNKADGTKQKYSAKQPGSSRGGSRSYSSDFGKLDAGKFAPQVQQYQTIDQASGNIPIINVVRPNIVHKISSSG